MTEPRMSYVLASVVVVLWVIEMLRLRHLNSPLRTVPLWFTGVLGTASIAFATASGLRPDHPQRFAVWSAVILVLAICAGWWRSTTVTLTQREHRVMRQGDWRTVVVWLAWVAVHFGLDQFAGHDAGVPQYWVAVLLWCGLFVSLLTQSIALWSRRHGADPEQTRQPQALV